jgi:hypothetical protein
MSTWQHGYFFTIDSEECSIITARPRQNNLTLQTGSRLGGVVVSVLPAEGSRVQNRPRTFKGDENPQHTFLRMGSKDGGPMS